MSIVYDFFGMEFKLQQFVGDTCNETEKSIGIYTIIVRWKDILLRLYLLCLERSYDQQKKMKKENITARRSYIFYKLKKFETPFLVRILFQLVFSFNKIIQLPRARIYLFMTKCHSINQQAQI